MPRVLITFDSETDEYTLDRASKDFDTTKLDYDRQALVEIPSAFWAEYCRISKARNNHQLRLANIFTHASQVGRETGRVHRYG